MLELTAPAFASFLLTLLAVAALRPLALAIELIDRPGGRKTHNGNVPIVGGLAMFLGIVLGTGLLPLPADTGTAYLGAAALLVTVGLLDDRFNLSPWMRLVVQVTAATVMIFGSGLVVTTLGDPFGVGTLGLRGAGSYVFTILVTVAAINAFNILDGIDGLAGGTAFIAVMALAALAWAAGQPLIASVGFVFAGAIAAFLLFNLPVQANRRVRCFMGDAGSTLLGFAVAWLCLSVSQSPQRVVSPVATLWVVALPLYEVVWSFTRRILRGVSPLTADSGHFHHLLRKAGFGVRGAFAVFVSLALALASFGILADRLGLAESWSFLLLVLAGVAVVRLMYRADLLWRAMPRALRNLPSLEATAGASMSVSDPR